MNHAPSENWGPITTANGVMERCSKGAAAGAGRDRENETMLRALYVRRDECRENQYNWDASQTAGARTKYSITKGTNRGPIRAASCIAAGGLPERPAGFTRARSAPNQQLNPAPHAAAPIASRSRSNRCDGETSQRLETQTRIAGLIINPRLAQTDCVVHEVASAIRGFTRKSDDSLPWGTEVQRSPSQLETQLARAAGKLTGAGIEGHSELRSGIQAPRLSYRSVSRDLIPRVLQ